MVNCLAIFNRIISLFFFLFTMMFISSCCANNTNDKSPKYPSRNVMEPIKKEREFNYLNINQLDRLNSGLYCWNGNNDCQLLDGKTTLFAFYQTSGNDNPTLIPYTYAEGEFLEGKYQGVWKYYDKDGKVIKKEKWDNGRLIYKKDFK